MDQKLEVDTSVPIYSFFFFEKGSHFFNRVDLVLRCSPTKFSVLFCKSHMAKNASI